MFNKSLENKDDSISQRKYPDWKSRYTKLYSTTRDLSLPKIQDSNRISFMSNDSNPYTMLLIKMREQKKDLQSTTTIRAPTIPKNLSSIQTLMSRQSETFDSFQAQPSTSQGNETELLDLVRARIRRSEEESLEKALKLQSDDKEEDPQYNEPCVHGLSVRMTDRSISRSRVSRISTRRDMDISSILAFTTNVPAPVHLEIPAFQKANAPQMDEIPRWSIRRSVCPVCSQKWRDKSSIRNVKYSGLKRNSSVELPSVIAPARLRTSIMIGYVPRPALAAVDEDAGVAHSGLRNSGAAWQLTRARRFRVPRPQVPPPEATAPPSATAPLARKDLDIRVNRFLTDEKEESSKVG